MSDDLAKIPRDEFEFALWHLNLRTDAESDPNLSSEARAAISGQFDILARAISTLGKLREEGLLQVQADNTMLAVAEGFHATMRIGAYYPDAPRTPPTLAANKKRMHAPHAGRRGGNVQEIVERHARRLWRSGQFLKNNRGTARKIYDAVASEIDSMPNPPKWWKPRVAQALGSEVVEKSKQSLRGEAYQETKRRRMEDIRKRVARIKRQDE